MLEVLLYFFAVLATLFAGWRLGRRTRFFLHVFQLETYKPVRYQRWVQSHVNDVVLRLSHMVAVAVLALAGVGFVYGPPVLVAIGALLLWTFTFISSRRYRRAKEKKALAFTSRMKRLTASTAFFALLPIVAGGVYGWSTGEASGIFWYLVGFFLADFGAPFWVLLGALAMQPVERSIQEGYKRQARAKLRERSDLTVIGITGSYGKTSTKFIIAELLRQKNSVLATPSSYNTPMGICLVVNNKLQPEHQILVLEYGMRYRGDIKELCGIAQPHISIVTTVGVAHLETMGSIENIAQEKGDLVTYMRPDGPAILNIDNEHVAAMAERAPGPVWRVSVDGRPEADITAHNIRYGAEGTSFVVKDDTGAEATFRTQLLGKHNVLNILLAVAVGRTMGMRLRQMAHAIGRVEPVEHRLALRQNGGVTIIDDAFNSNPVGARNAVEILSQVGDGRRVIVTPGMVELGERQWGENKALGEHIARHDIDLAVLIGDKQTAPIQEGLREQRYPNERLKVFPSLFDAQEFLKSYLRPGDVVLYENDLPDQYSDVS